MGCGTCGTKTADGTPAGCKSNGTCGTTGCNKLNVYNWLSDMELPHGQPEFDIVEVRFKGSRKEFYRNVNNLELREGDIVAVEGNPGHDIGVVSLRGELVRIQMKRRHFSEGETEVRNLFRLARPADIQKWEEMKNAEFETMHISRKAALEYGLKMKLSDVEYQGDGKKVTFFYTADERVDFRELIKKLAERFKTRIEMRQIGMRQEAARLGAIGSCGRELCCSTWLTDFKAVTTTAARYQNLSLNPLKLAGQCGKLKCCLNYELDSYMDAVRDFPDTNLVLWSQKGTARHVKTDIFKRMMWYAFQPNREGQGEEGGYTPGGEWVPLPVDRVKEIIELNIQKIKPEDLREEDDADEQDYQPDYENVVGQDSITRMDNKKKKKKKKPSQNSGGNAVASAVSNNTESGDTAAPTAQPPRGGSQPQQGQTRRPQQGGQQPRQNTNQPQRPPQNAQQPQKGAQGGNQNPKPPQQQNQNPRPAQNANQNQRPTQGGNQPQRTPQNTNAPKPPQPQGPKPNAPAANSNDANANKPASPPSGNRNAPPANAKPPQANQPPANSNPAAPRPVTPPPPQRQRIIPPSTEDN
nr:hypothetical protein [Bacteroidota bacterium]